MKTILEPSRELYDQADDHKAKFVAKPGLNKEIVEHISKVKNEPDWMLNKRLKGLEPARSKTQSEEPKGQRG